MDKFFLDAAFVIALTELVKRTANVPTRFLPLVSISFGIILAGLGFGWNSAVILEGLTIGLVASGLFSAGKASIGK